MNIHNINVHFQTGEEGSEDANEAKLVFLFLPSAIPLAPSLSLRFPSPYSPTPFNSLVANFSSLDGVNTRKGLDIRGPRRPCRVLQTIHICLLISPTPAGFRPVHASKKEEEQGEGGAGRGVRKIACSGILQGATS